MRSLHLLALTLLCTVFPAAAVELVALDPSGSASADPPELRVLERDEGHLRLRWTLPALQVESVEAGGETWQALSLPGGSLSGEAGAPGLPVFSRLIALPEGASATLRVVSREDCVLPVGRLFPVQPDEAEEFVLDRAAYSRIPRSAEAASLGEPGHIRGLNVAPLTLRPARYDPTSGDLSLAESMEIEVEITGGERGVAPDFIPESFDRLYSDLVVGYERDEDTEVGLGTWLLICDNNASLLDSLQPLFDWRSRQGYHVMLGTTDVIGNSETNIKNYIQGVYDTVDPPLEYVVLAGDATGSYSIDCWFENLSGYHGEGDHYYSTLEGGDILADVHVGRLPFSSLTEIGFIVRKIVRYESDPPTGDTSWFTRASVCGDPSSSGITTVYVNQWLKEQLLQHGYAQVDTIWSGNFVSQMLSNLNNGLSVFGYRGYWFMSGMDASHITSSSNGYELPFAVVVTCDTGSFYSDNICRSEAFLRAPHGGGIGGVGTATTGTHTRYNNCYYHGVWEGAINGSDHHLGAAHTRGKYELYNNYQYAEPNRVEIWSMWNNLMGDPATDMWTGVPAAMSVTHPMVLNPAANAVPLTVTVGGIPVTDARVTLHQEGNLAVSGVTDATGKITLPLEGVMGGELLVTVMKHNHLAYLGSIQIAGGGSFIGLQEFAIDDDEFDSSLGNGDGEANPGERLELPVALRNFGLQGLDDITATLTSSDPFVTITDGEESFGDIPGGGTAWSYDDFDFDLDPAVPDGHVLNFDLLAIEGEHSWTSLVQVDVVSAAYTIDSTIWSEGDPAQPGETGELVLSLTNVGHQIGTGIAGTLSTLSPWVDITDDAGSWPPVAPGFQSGNGANPFALTIGADCLPGYQIPFRLDLSFNDGAEATIFFGFPVGEITLQDPSGPDAYGYYALDDTDDPFIGAPEFDWVEIDPSYGGPGTDMGLTDFGWEQDDTRVFDLPFEFQYYGDPFDRISVCSNGWVAMGETYLKHYRNWNIPGAGTPRWMIAAFWDNLYQTGTNRVYHWYDSSQHRYIIQWSRVRNPSNSTENFELILYDPAYHPTVTGDGIIEVQYEDVTNNDGTNGYATVGVQNGDRSTGLCYTYWNGYAPGAMILSDGRAIRFMPLTRIPLPECSVLPGHVSKILAPDQTASDWLHVSNSGEEGSTLSFELEIVDPDLAGRSVENSTFGMDPSHYLPGDSFDVTVTVQNASADGEALNLVTLDFPPGVTVNSGTALTGSTGSLAHSGTGDGVLVQWYDDDGGAGNILAGDTATATLNLSFDSAEGDLTLPWSLRGDDTGADPHSVTGQFFLIYDGPGVELLAPNGGELWIVGEENEILFSGTVSSTAVDLSLRRGVSGDWETLAEGVPTAQGSWPWTVTGPGNRDCWVRVSDSVYPEIDDESLHSFTIMNPIDWLSLSVYEGDVPDGETEDIEMLFDAAGLSEGTYVVNVIVSHNAGEDLVLPVTLLVNETGTATDETPGVTLLAQNHPNPFNPATSISFSLSQEGPVRLEVFDSAGRRVRVLQDGMLPAGGHHFLWQGRDDRGRSLASGVYFYRLEAEGRVQRRKMTLIK